VKTYSVGYANSARKEMKRLPKQVVTRIEAAILALQNNPRPSNCIKLQDEENLYRIRVGDYRVVYTISDEAVTILIIRVRHRKDAYD